MTKERGGRDLEWDMEFGRRKKDGASPTAGATIARVIMHHDDSGRDGGEGGSSSRKETKRKEKTHSDLQKIEIDSTP